MDAPDAMDEKLGSNRVSKEEGAQVAREQREAPR
jgi:hypothetical protein